MAHNRAMDESLQWTNVANQDFWGQSPCNTSLLANSLHCRVDSDEVTMLGRFEEAILLVLIGAKGEATTAEIYEALCEKLKREVTFGAIYTTLDRMRDKKFVTRRKGEPLAHRGGKARYYCKITSHRRAAVIESQKLTAEWNFLPETTIPAR